MTQSARDTFGQARQGSVAAIIHILNDQLVGAGVRTRAVVSDGMLQILCEAASPEQLEKKTLVERVRNTLETISPQRIKKVKINSRIVKEDQLLWIEEINRDPAKALLWSEVIVLKRPFFVERWIRDRHLKPAGPVFKDISEPESNKFALLLRVIGWAGALLILLVAGWFIYQEVGPQLLNAEADPDTTEPVSPSSEGPPGDRPAVDEPSRTTDTTAPPTASLADSADSPAAELPEASQTPADALETDPAEEGADTAVDAFAEAVRIAEQAAIEGQRATTATTWLDLAARWQQASDLMSEIPVGSEEYEIAQDRIQTYQANSQAALRQATAARKQ